MKWNEYVPNAKRTETLPTEGWRGAIPVMLWRLNHAVLGLVTEISEFKLAADSDLLTKSQNQNEEIGDLAWYTAIASDALGLQLDDHTPGIAGYPIDAMQAEVAALTNIVKRSIYYLKDTDVAAARTAVTHIYGALRNLTDDDNAFEQILERNIAKLRARYPGKWTAEQAVNRDLAAEAAALKQG
jgi:hypothetical protein